MISRTVRSPSTMSSSLCSGLVSRSDVGGLDRDAVGLQHGLEAAQARLDDAPLVDAAEALHDDRRDGQAELRALGERGQRLESELEAPARPAQHLVHELARLARERVAELIARHATRVDEQVAEQPPAGGGGLRPSGRGAARAALGRRRPRVGVLSRRRRSMSSVVTSPCSMK